MTRLVRLLPLAVLCSCAAVPRLRTPPPPPALEGSYVRFPTGLQLAVYEDPAALRTTVTVSYGGGEVDEPLGEGGIAHVAEHLTFRARPGGPGAPTLSERAEALGATITGFSNSEDTAFVDGCPPDRLREVLAIEADRMRAPLASVVDADLEEESATAKIELLEQRNEWTALLPVIFADHPYGRPSGETVMTLSALSLTDARKWTAQQYTPRNAVIVISGPVKAAGARAAVEAAFGGMATGEGFAKGSPVEHAPPAAPAASGGQQMRIIEAKVRNRVLYAAWILEGRYWGDLGNGAAAAAVLRGALQRQFLFDPRLESAQVKSLLLSGAMVVAARLELREGTDAQGIADEVGKLCPPELGSSAITEQSMQALADEAFASLESLDGQEIARYVRATGRSDFTSALQRQLSAGLGGPVGTFVNERFTRKAMRTVLMLPSPAFRTVVEAHVPGGEEAARSAPMDEHDLPPGDCDPKTLLRQPFQTTRFTTREGLEVVAVRRSRVPRVDARLLVRTRPRAAVGNAFIPEISSEAAFLQARTQLRDLPWLNDFGRTGDGFTVEGATVLNQDLPDALRVLGEWVRGSGGAPSATAYGLSGLMYLVHLNAAIADPGTQKAELRTSHLFARDEPAADLEKVREALLKSEASESSDWAFRELRPQNATLILVGDLPDDRDLRDEVEAAFSGWGNKRGPLESMGLTAVPPRSAGIPWPPAPPAPKGRRVMLFRGDSRSADVVVAVRGPALDMKDAAAWAVLDTLLESRLRRELRSHRGLAYRVLVRTDDYRNATMLQIAASVESKHAPEAVKEILAAVDSLGRGGPPAESELRQARWAVARRYAGGFGTVHQIGDALEWALSRDAKETIFDSLPADLAAVDASRIAALGKQLSAGGEAITVSGDVTWVDEPLKAAGYRVEQAPAK